MTKSNYEKIEENINGKDCNGLREALGNLCYTSRDFSSGEFDKELENAEKRVPEVYQEYDKKQLVSDEKSEYTAEDFSEAVFLLKENFCKERINDVKKIGKALYGNNKSTVKIDKEIPKVESHWRMITILLMAIAVCITIFQIITKKRK